jgi:hypothetical protein
MASLAEDPTWYDQFQRAAEAQVNPAAQRAVIPGQDLQAKEDIFSEILKWSLKIIRRRTAEVAELPSAISHNAPAVHYELNNFGAAAAEFNLELLEWNRGKTV